MTRRSNPDPQNRVSPDAYLLGRWFTAARREGLLTALTPEAWHTLSAVLSFTRRDGGRSFTLDQLALATGQPREIVEARLRELARTAWNGEPLLQPECDPAGDLCGALLAPLELLARVTGSSRATVPEPTVAQPAKSAEAAGDAELQADLHNLGLNESQIGSLLRSYGPARIRRQLGWLPERHARNPAALLIRAVEQDWEPPREAP
ncbi:MAG: hypothetical protein ACK47B_12485 [Armatimonadota bacterium]